jgi:hypothetical protein
VLRGVLRYFERTRSFVHIVGLHCDTGYVLLYMPTGVYFVPAFAGLYAPHWRGDARGVIAGLTAFNTKVLVRVFVRKEVCIGAGCGHT